MAHFWTIWCYFANIFNSFSFLRCWLITLLWTRYNNSRDIALGYNVIITRCIRMEFGNRVPMNGRGMWEQVLGIAANPDSREPGEGCHRVQPSLTPTDRKLERRWRELVMAMDTGQSASNKNQGSYLLCPQGRCGRQREDGRARRGTTVHGTTGEWIRSIEEILC